MSTDTLTLQEAADYLHAHQETIREKAKAKLIPGRKVGRRWVFSRRQLLRWLEGDYSETDSQAAPTGGKDPWVSESAVMSGGLTSKSTDDEYNALLGLPTGHKP